ncbi:MAG: hypothetical protein KJ757_07340, partial [Planctomycetes bacterium]|nr:hypothetical protein [Planctomycetota bacterium]
MVRRFVKILMILLVFTPLALAVGTQPQALDVAGVYKIAGIDPNLTGEGISIGLVCRSDTYIDSKPQNDYRPDISHKCFENSSVDF